MIQWCAATTQSETEHLTTVKCLVTAMACLILIYRKVQSQNILQSMLLSWHVVENNVTQHFFYNNEDDITAKHV